MTARRHRVRLKRQRVRLKWIAQWEGDIEKLAKSIIKQNIWRVDPINEENDLMQDAYLLFMKLYDYYPRVVDPPHFVTLFKRALNNKMHDHARSMQKKHVVYQISDHTSDQLSQIMGEVTNAGYLKAVIAEAPQELQMALMILDTNPEVVRADGPKRENLNMRLKRAIGFEGKADLSGMLRSLLTT